MSQNLEERVLKIEQRNQKVELTKRGKPAGLGDF